MCRRTRRFDWCVWVCAPTRVWRWTTAAKKHATRVETGGQQRRKRCQTTRGVVLDGGSGGALLTRSCSINNNASSATGGMVVGSVSLTNSGERALAGAERRGSGKNALAGEKNAMGRV